MALAIGLLIGVTLVLFILVCNYKEGSGDDLMIEQKKTNELLEKILKECKRNSDLVDAYNRKYHV